MAGNECVPDRVCEEVRKNNKERLDQGERRMNAHGEDITDLKIIMAQLTQLQTTNTAALAAMEARVQELETCRHTREEERSPPNETFFDSQSKQLIIKGTFFLLGVIVLAAIGQNVSPDFVAKLFGK